MVSVVDIVVYGTLVSAFYALLSVGLTLLYSIARIDNLAHGTYVMVGAYTSYIVVSHLGLSPIIGLGVAIVAGSIAGVATWYGYVKHVMEKPMAIFMGTLLLALAAEQVVTLIFGAQPQLQQPIIAGTVSILGTNVTWNLILAFFVSWICLIALGSVLRWTVLGRSIVAVAQNRRSAELAGISTERVFLIVWIVAGGFAGLVGVFYGYYSSLDPSMWTFPLIYSFSIVIVGGIGSLRGTVLAAYIIGFIEMTTVQIEPRLKGVAALLVLILIMLLRPQGLFGRQLGDMD